MSRRSQPKSRNSLLAALPKAEYQRLIPHLKSVSVSKGEVLHASDEPAEAVYFLEQGVASLSVSTDEGKKLQLSIVGNESVVGERAIFKHGVFIIRCAMLTDGSGHKVPPAIFHKEFDRGGVLHDLVLGRIEARITETAQTALCNQMHPIEQRLSRWLLTFADRLHSEELPTTQELIADMLGVTRSEISRAAGELREGNLIDYTRGRLTVLNRAGLEGRACECYEVIKHAIKEFTSSKQ
ncbi:MAG: Crp/Fnr family transcriptional regulator [Pyrinomonadaceae bacterium]